jgi:osmotically-inducible protein OsmY
LSLQALISLICKRSAFQYLELEIKLSTIKKLHHENRHSNSKRCDGPVKMGTISECCSNWSSRKNGIVTLSGQVNTYPKKLIAENAAKKIAGVKAIAEDIQIGVSPANKKTDAEIAEAVLTALKWHTAVQEEKIKIKVEDGYIRLEGEVEWNFQRTNAASAIENLAGVRSVINLITLKSKVTASDIEGKINAAFRRSATIDAGKITAEVIGSKVILRGKVRSFAEKEDAENAAWFAPGVTFVESTIEIETPEYSYEY